jgi:putative ABC transport system substrate-binding protein
VESLARPGGNLTGLDVRVFELMGKRLELVKEAVPTIARVAVLVDPANPIYQEVPHNIAREAQALGVQLQRVEVGGPAELWRVSHRPVPALRGLRGQDPARRQADRFTGGAVQ